MPVLNLVTKEPALLTEICHIELVSLADFSGVSMVEWLTRILLATDGAITIRLVARDTSNFSLTLGAVAMLLLALTVAALAFRPAGWKTCHKHLDSSQR
jgi:hypothetical protein